MSQRLWFSLDPERAHRVALRLLRLGGATALGRALIRARYGGGRFAQPVTLWGLTFKNRLGLAAGWDKDGLGLCGLACLPFGHIEVGTVTPLPQAGNPQPRVFRLREDQALINRMGFPGRGAAFVETRLRTFLKTFPDAAARPIVGVNIGRNKATPNERALDDYRALLLQFAPLADYLVINISSPNTAGLRDLQARDALETMLGGLAEARRTMPEAAQRTPLLVKLSPDLSHDALADAVGAALANGIDGLVVSNTTLAREGLKSRNARESGGMSGAPLGARADALLRQTVALVAGKVPIIASGGVMNGDDFRRKISIGADLVQVYTGLIYGGPRWPKRIVACPRSGV